MWWQGGVACAEVTSDAGESKVEDGEVESVVAALVPFGVNLVENLCKVHPSPVEVVAGGKPGDEGEGRLDAAKFGPDGLEVVACEVGVEGAAGSTAVICGFE